MFTITTTCNIGKLFSQSETYPIIYNYLIIIVYKIMIRPGILFEFRGIGQANQINPKM